MTVSDCIQSVTRPIQKDSTNKDKKHRGLNFAGSTVQKASLTHSVNWNNRSGVEVWRGSPHLLRGSQMSGEVYIEMSMGSDETDYYRVLSLSWPCRTQRPVFEYQSIGNKRERSARCFTNTAPRMEAARAFLGPTAGVGEAFALPMTIRHMLVLERSMNKRLNWYPLMLQSLESMGSILLN